MRCEHARAHRTPALLAAARSLHTNRCSILSVLILLECYGLLRVCMRGGDIELAERGDAGGCTAERVACGVLAAVGHERQRDRQGGRRECIVARGYAPGLLPTACRLQPGSSGVGLGHVVTRGVWTVLSQTIRSHCAACLLPPASRLQPNSSGIFVGLSRSGRLPRVLRVVALHRTSSLLPTPCRLQADCRSILFSFLEGKTNLELLGTNIATVSLAAASGLEGGSGGQLLLVSAACTLAATHRLQARRRFRLAHVILIVARSCNGTALGHGAPSTSTDNGLNTHSCITFGLCVGFVIVLVRLDVGLILVLIVSLTVRHWRELVRYICLRHRCLRTHALPKSSDVDLFVVVALGFCLEIHGGQRGWRHRRHLSWLRLGGCHGNNTP